MEKEIRNLISLFRMYYKLSIPDFIGSTANSLFLGLLYKFNERGFENSLKISNKELLTLSGITDIRTFRNARKTLTDYLHDEDDPSSWLVKYTQGKMKEYGVYRINYVILQEYYSNVTVKMSELDRDRSKISTDLDPISNKSAPLSEIIQDLKEETTSSSSSINSISVEQDKVSDDDVFLRFLLEMKKDEKWNGLTDKKYLELIKTYGERNVSACMMKIIEIDMNLAYKRDFENSDVKEIENYPAYLIEMLKGGFQANPNDPTIAERLNRFEFMRKLAEQ